MLLMLLLFLNHSDRMLSEYSASLTNNVTDMFHKAVIPTVTCKLYMYTKRFPEDMDVNKTLGYKTETFHFQSDTI